MGLVKGDHLYNFIRDCYQIICIKKKSISYVDSSSKHTNETKPDVATTKYEYTAKDCRNVLIRETNQSVDIVNFLSISKDCKATIKNVSSISSSGFQSIGSFEYRGYERVLEGNIYFKNGGIEERRNLQEWLDDCIATCEEIVDLYEKTDFS